MGAGPREKVLDWAGLAGLSAGLGLGRWFGLGLGLSSFLFWAEVGLGPG